MPVVLVVLGVVVVATLGWWLARRGAEGREAESKRVAATAQRTGLQYVVPEGQDPAAVLLELDQAGFRSGLAEDRGERIITVDVLGDGTQGRDEVRATITRAGTTLQDSAAPQHAIRFRDETGPV